MSSEVIITVTYGILLLILQGSVGSYLNSAPVMSTLPIGNEYQFILPCSHGKYVPANTNYL